MNMQVTDPIVRDARYLRMLLVDAFVAAQTWDDMMRIGEGLAKLNRIEREMHAEWLHLHPSPSAAGQCQSPSTSGAPHE